MDLCRSTDWTTRMYQFDFANKKFRNFMASLIVLVVLVLTTLFLNSVESKAQPSPVTRELISKVQLLETPTPKASPTSPPTSESSKLADLVIAKKALLRVPNVRAKYDINKIRVIHGEYCIAGKAKNVVCFNPKRQSFSFWSDFDPKPWFGN